MSKSKRIEKPFTNKFGHTFNPGDPCFVIGTISEELYHEEA